MKKSLPDNQSTQAGKRVYVGLSGGVDSSVAAALLQKEGYDVTGVFIKGWHPEFLPCTWKEDRQDAMRVAATLGIPFRTLDLGQEYYDHVVTYLINEYREGRTPNPDVMCNRRIKFGAFLSWARDEGADFVATGHYVRISKVDDHYHLLAGADAQKDQSYFLWTLKQEDLARILFPIGEYEKPKVRDLAAVFDLPTKDKPDSQGVCFIGKLDMKEFLSRYIKTTPGEVLDTTGQVIGSHDGAAFYTIGQRHGFSVRHTGPSSAPHYVISKDMESNTLTVAPILQTATGGKEELSLDSVNWVGESAPKTGEVLNGRFRYRQELRPYRVVSVAKNEASLEPLDGPLHAPEGQSLVLYSGEECLGGGIIR